MKKPERRRIMRVGKESENERRDQERKQHRKRGRWKEKDGVRKGRWRSGERRDALEHLRP